MTGNAALHELIRLLGSGRLRQPIGVLQVPPRWCEHADDLAVQLGLDYVDLRALVLDRLRPDQRTLGWGWEGLAEQLRQIAAQPPRVGACTLVGNLDLLLARLEPGDCARWWRYMRMAAVRHGLLLVMPTHAEELFPDEERDVWRAGGRLVEWTDRSGGS